jgi:hypothetical protein
MLSTHTGLSPTLARLSRRFWFLHVRHWPGPRSLATTSGVSVDVLSSGYLDVSVRRVSIRRLCIQRRTTHNGPGCPIRKSPDQSLLPTPRGLSQSATSFIASWCQGIHQMPYSRLRSSNPCAGTKSRRTNAAQQHTALTSHHGVKRQDVQQEPIPFHLSNSLKAPGRSPCCFPRTCTISAGAIAANGGGERNRTDDLLLAKQALSQLSYTPEDGGPG